MRQERVLGLGSGSTDHWQTRWKPVWGWARIRVVEIASADQMVVVCAILRKRSTDHKSALFTVMEHILIFQQRYEKSDGEVRVF